MYFSAISADPKAMTESDYVVAVTLSESDIIKEVADKWITLLYVAKYLLFLGVFNIAINSGYEID